MATVRSVEKESTTKISSAKARLSRQAWRLTSSLKVVTRAVKTRSRICELIRLEAAQAIAYGELKTHDARA